jgi:hypothetical protein
VGDHNADRTLIEHWNGRAWKIQPSANPSPVFNRVTGVAAISSSSASAVGVYWTKKFARRILIEHWNGRAWKG